MPVRVARSPPEARRTARRYPPLPEVRMVAALLVVFAAASPPPCPARAPPSALVPPGEQLRFKLDVLGAAVGTLDATAGAPGVTSGGRKAALELRGRAKTNAFVSTTLGEYYAVAPAL